MTADNARPFLALRRGDSLPAAPRADLVNDGPPRWHALRVSPQREDQAEDWLRLRGVYAFHPVLRRVTTRMGKRVEHQRRYLPGYVFARFPGAAVISRVMSCPWITGAVCLSGGEWGVLDPQALRAIHAMRATDRKARAAAAEAAELRRRRRIVLPGQAAMFQAGPLAGQSCEVIEIDAQGGARVALPLFGQQALVVQAAVADLIPVRKAS